jgi:hypothetical protein
VSPPVDRELDKETMARWNAEALAQALDELALTSPNVARVLAALPLTQMSGLEAVCWWTAADGWLDNRQPWDILLDDTNAAEQAACRLAEPSPL